MMVSKLIETQTINYIKMIELRFPEILFTISIIFFLIAIVVILPTLIFDRFFKESIAAEAFDESQKEEVRSARFLPYSEKHRQL